MATTTMQKQQILLHRLGELLSYDLGYIWGERESGPNGEKKEFLDKGKRFLTQPGKDLGFGETKISKNPSGIAVSGEVTIAGMWSEGNGLYVSLSAPHGTHYRSTRYLRDCIGGHNHFLSAHFMQATSYGDFIKILSVMNNVQMEVTHGAAA